MNYEGRIIRPPSEADSLILQVTVGCSHNRCTFCPAFKDKKFRIKPLEDIKRDIQQAVKTYGAQTVRRVFLCDGDPLIIP
ncbi:MAG: radical SAM protein, partial [Deltaproteobacteria bacterium]|nr:radical SAM protein [Deltaproteobacteria bacterium]